jgi:very-short-patch-repair endonuclease
VVSAAQTAASRAEIQTPAAHPGFIADFACVEARLVIELDGGQHARATEADRLRSDALAAAGCLVLRFWNSDVLRNIDGVLATIADALDIGSASEGLR